MFDKSARRIGFVRQPGLEVGLNGDLPGRCKAQRIAIRSCVGEHRQGDDFRGTLLIRHNHRAANRPAERVCEAAGQNVDDGTGAERYKKLNWPVG